MLLVFFSYFYPTYYIRSPLPCLFFLHYYYYFIFNSKKVSIITTTVIKSKARERINSYHTKIYIYIYYKEREREFSGTLHNILNQKRASKRRRETRTTIAPPIRCRCRCRF